MRVVQSMNEYFARMLRSLCIEKQENEEYFID